MFLYSLYGYEYNIVLIHKKCFSQDEFEKMCNEVPKEDWGFSDNELLYNEDEIIKHLTNKRGFKIIEYQACLFID